MYEMITGKVPFDRPNSVEHPDGARERGRRLRCAQMNPNINPSPAHRGDRRAAAWRRIPDQRFRSMDEVLAALKRVGGARADGDGQRRRAPASTARSRLRQRAAGRRRTAPARAEPGVPVAERPAIPGASRRRSRCRATRPPPAPPLVAAARARRARRGCSSRAVVGALALAGIVGYVALRPSKPGSRRAAPPRRRRRRRRRSRRAPPRRHRRAAADGRRAASSSAKVRVNTDPDGASVKEDGVELCSSTPCDITLQGRRRGPDARSTSSRSSEDGYRSETRTVKIGDSPVDREAARAAPRAYAAGRPAPKPADTQALPTGLQDRHPVLTRAAPKRRQRGKEDARLYRLLYPRASGAGTRLAASRRADAMVERRRCRAARASSSRSSPPRFRLDVDGARNVAQRNLARIVAGLVLRRPRLSSGGALADERTEARAHFKKGMAAIADGQYEDGHRGAQGAYEILPHPNVLYNIARAYVESGDLESAVAYYQKYLEGNPQGPRRGRADRRRARGAHPQAAGAAPRVAAGADRRRPAPAAPGAGRRRRAGPRAGDRRPAGRDRRRGRRAGRRAGRRRRPAARHRRAALKTEEVFEETVVTASKAAQSPLDAPNSTSIITEQDIRLSGITKIPELLRRLAGVDIMETTGSQTEVSLRGFNQRLSNKVLVLINGRSVYVDLLGATFWATLSIGVEDIERIEVVRGPGSALYGADAFNGVINIITKAPGEGGSGFNVGYGDHNTTHGTIYASGRDKEIAYRIVGRLRLPAALEPRGPARPRRPARSATRRPERRRSRPSASTAPSRGSSARTSPSACRAATRTGRFEILGVGPINDVVITDFTSTDVTAFLNSKHFEVRAFFNRLEGDERAQRRVHRPVAPARRVQPERRRRRGAVHRPVRDRQAASTTISTSASTTGSRTSTGRTWRTTETENHARLLRPRRGQDRASASPSSATTAPTTSPTSNSIVQSPRVSVLFHPSKQSTIRGIVGTAFRTPDFLESYTRLPHPAPASRAARAQRRAQRPDQPGFKLQPRAGLHGRARVPQLRERLLHDRHARSSTTTSTTSSSSRPTRAITVGDLATPRCPRLQPADAASTRSSSAASRTSARRTTSTAPSSACACSRSRVSTSTRTTRS